MTKAGRTERTEMPDGKENKERGKATRLGRRYLSSKIQLLRAGQRWRGGAHPLIGQHIATGCYESKLGYLSLVPLARPLSLAPQLLPLAWDFAELIPLCSSPMIDDS